MDALTSRPPTPLPQLVARGVLAAVLLAVGLYTLWSFMAALVWAAIFAIALWPWFERVRRRFVTKHNIMVPLLFTLGVALVFIVPLGLVGMQLVGESHQAMQWLHGARANGIPEPDVLRRLPVFAGPVATWWQDNVADPGAVGELLGRFGRGNAVTFSRAVGAQVARRLTLFAFTLVALFFLFRGGPSLISQMARANARAFGPGGERIMLQIVASIHGTVDGLVLVGLAEGLLLGVVYAVAGVPHPTVFGALTAVAAMIPFAAPLVFAVCALLLVAKGSLVAAIVVFVLGMLTTFTADHFIRPVLIGGATKLPFLWVLLGILGGVETWGLIGLFVGPAVMAVLILLWREWADDNATPLPAPSPAEATRAGLPAD